MEILQNLTNLLEPFNCKIIYSDLENFKLNNAEYRDIKSLIADSEILIISAPLTEKTKRYHKCRLFKRSYEIGFVN